MEAVDHDLEPGLAAYVRDAVHANGDRHKRVAQRLPASTGAATAGRRDITSPTGVPEE